VPLPSGHANGVEVDATTQVAVPLTEALALARSGAATGTPVAVDSGIGEVGTNMDLLDIGVSLVVPWDKERGALDGNGDVLTIRGETDETDSENDGVAAAELNCTLRLGDCKVDSRCGEPRIELTSGREERYSSGTSGVAAVPGKPLLNEESKPGLVLTDELIVDNKAVPNGRSPVDEKSMLDGPSAYDESARLREVTLDML